MASIGKYQPFNNDDDLLDNSRYSFSHVKLRMHSDPPEHHVHDDTGWEQGDLSAAFSPRTDAQDPNIDPASYIVPSGLDSAVLEDLKMVIDQVDFSPPGGEGRFTADNNLEVCQGYVRRVTDHIVFRIFTILMTLLDIVLIVVDLTMPPDDEMPFSILSLVIVSYFLLEVGARIFAVGWRSFFQAWIEATDCVIVCLSFVLAVVFTSLPKNHSAEYVKLLVAGRLVRLIRFYKLISEKKHLTQASRQLVSQNKRRYQQDGFDLDLCYITKRVIAMSFPSTGYMAWYRNPIMEVARFLDLKHKDHYRVYNLCSERTYDESIFHNRVHRVPMADHNVPLLSDMVSFAENARAWMDADPDNVMAIHCKGGKGRTGTIICTWLITDGLFDQAQDSLMYFGDRRTDLSVGQTFQGVETPSQSRYVGYYETAKRMSKSLIPRLPADRRLRIKTLEVNALKGIGTGDGSDLSFIVMCQNQVMFDCDFTYGMNCNVKYDEETDHLTAHIMNCPILVNDVKVQFASKLKSVPLGYDRCPFYFWFHTSFIEGERLHLSREELDNPHKCKTWKVYSENFSVTLTFVRVDEDGMDEISVS